MKTVLFLAPLIFVFSACSSSSEKSLAQPNLTAPETLEAAVAASYRTPEFTARDSARHPLETLTFFGLTPEMTVVEVSPSAGWYTQILAPFLNTKGQYIAAQVPSSFSEYMKGNNDKRMQWLSAHQAITSKAQVVDFTPTTSPLAPDNSVDMVLTFRNIHNWLGNKSADAAFKSFFKALKPGGILGVVEHRADAKQKSDPLAKSGYMREADVIKMVQKAGFKLVSKSEINANPKDTKNHPEGVWTLPPSYRLKDKDREKYAAIGESDRMTLKFQKPAAKK